MSDPSNVQQAVPLFGVRSMETSLKFYVDGLGFHMKNRWIDQGTLRWCSLEHGAAAIMLQQLARAPEPSERLGAGLSLNFICRDAIALYRLFLSRGVQAKPPFVGNGMWVVSVRDPDGYELHFESETEVPEETEYSEAEHGPP